MVTSPAMNRPGVVHARSSCPSSSRVKHNHSHVSELDASVELPMNTFILQISVALEESQGHLLAGSPLSTCLCSSQNRGRFRTS